MNVHENARLTAHSRAELVLRVLDQGQPRKVVAAASDLVGLQRRVSARARIASPYA